MEDSSYIDLKKSLSSIPAKALNYSSRLKLANNLNVKLVLTAKNGHARDYGGFAELMGFQYNDIRKFERHDDPTLKILESWESYPNATLDKLIGYLEEMERHDVIKEIIPLLEKDVEMYLQNQKLQEIPIQVPEVTSCPENMHGEKEMQLFTRHDIKNGECTYYDAYVSYADADITSVRRLANYLESPQIGLKLFIRLRDMLAGYAELDTNIELIKNRCRRMLIILTPNYLKSPACEFQTNFAASLAIDQSHRMLIPVIIEPCEIPLILKYVSKIDFTKPGNNNWVYEKLINSLLPEDRSPMFLSSLEKSSMQRIMPPKFGSSVPVENNPAITFPKATKNNPAAELPSITSVSSENAALKDLTVVSSKTHSPKKWKLQLSSHLKKASISSSVCTPSDSNLSSSSATSGFHSQSSSALENFVEDDEQ